jgi:hypothetical protein
MKSLSKNRVFAFLVAGFLAWPLLSACSDDGSTSCTPTAEQCNSSDDDCDGLTDEDSSGNPLTQSCTTTLDLPGTQTCVDGSWAACMSDCDPQAEACNNLDDDCDGETDEDETGSALTRDCSSDCGPGTEVCANGQWVHCTAPEPSTEECNGLDDDCNGQTDEGFECPISAQQNCGTELGDCEYGVQICDNTCHWGQCLGSVEPDTEVCEGTHDEDCDGTVDNGCDCTNGQEQQCCDGTMITCAGGTWPTCPPPPAETCDGVDNDCNGLTDDNLPVDPYMLEEDVTGLDDCAHAEDIGTTVVELAGAVTLGPYYLYKQNLSGDADYFQFSTEELNDITCVINPSYNECYTLSVVLTEPSAADYEFCLHLMGPTEEGPYGDCASPDGVFCSTDDAPANELHLDLHGGCGSSENLVFYLEVFAVSGNYESCQPYSVTVEYIGSGPQSDPCS